MKPIELTEKDFTLSICYEEDDTRPKNGWRIYYHTPEGLQPFATKRKNVLKFRRLYDALKWTSQHRPGYRINLNVKCYHGVIEQDRKK